MLLVLVTTLFWFLFVYTKKVVCLSLLFCNAYVDGSPAVLGVVWLAIFLLGWGMEEKISNRYIVGVTQTDPRARLLFAYMHAERSV